MGKGIAALLALGTAITLGFPAANASAAPQVSFILQEVAASPTYAEHLAAADVDGDGNLDVISVFYEGLSVILGDGTGRFGPPITTPTEAQLAFAVVVGDVDEDGDPDIIVADVLSKNVLVYRGNGQGGFARATVAVETGGVELDLGIGDLDLDGHLDLVLTQSDRQLDVLSGSGDGSFTGTDHVRLTETANGVAVEDVDGDGAPDVAVGSYVPFGGSFTRLVQVLLNDGTGDLSLGQPLQAGRNPSSLAFGDLDGDRVPDLVAANRSSANSPSDLTRSSVSIFIGNGDGTFGPATYYAAGRSPASVAVADFDTNGTKDLAVLDRGARPSVNILLGDGAGAVGAPAAFPTRGLALSPLVGRFNADRQPDIVAAGRSGYVVVGINNTRQSGS